MTMNAAPFQVDGLPLTIAQLERDGNSTRDKAIFQPYPPGIRFEDYLRLVSVSG